VSNTLKRINVKTNLFFIAFESLFFVFHFSRIMVLFFCKTIWRAHDPSIIPEIVDMLLCPHTRMCLHDTHEMQHLFMFIYHALPTMECECSVTHLKRLIRKLIRLFAKTCNKMTVYYLELFM